MPLMRYILSRTVFQLSRNIDNIIAFDMRCLYLTDSFCVISATSHIYIHLYSPYNTVAQANEKENNYDTSTLHT